MKQSFTIACGNNWEDRCQATMFKEAIEKVFPGISLENVAQDGVASDFRLIHDIASTDATSQNIAVLKRGILNNCILFQKDIETAIQGGQTVVIAVPPRTPTILLRRFFQKALPATGHEAFCMDFEIVEATVENQLIAIDNGWYDAMMISVERANQLLQNPMAEPLAEAAVRNKKIMILPLFECPPTVGQADTVIAALHSNADAMAVLAAINHATSKKALLLELELEQRYRQNNLTEVGVVHLEKPLPCSFIIGIDLQEKLFTDWVFEMYLDIKDKEIFASTDYMKDFFDYALLENMKVDDTAQAVFISSHKAVHSGGLIHQISQKKIWAAGTRTWYELAKKGLWVEGCADGLGLEFLLPLFVSELLPLSKENIQIITNTSSCGNWQKEGWNALGTYELVDTQPRFLQEKISEANIIFWSSFQQYEAYKRFLQPNVIHASPAGKTAKLLTAAGLQPKIFPTIKAFIDWRKKQEPTA